VLAPIRLGAGLRNKVIHAMACRAPVVAVSPLVGGHAVKGPTAKMLKELGLPVDALTAARRYAGLLDGYIVDATDAHALPPVNVPVTVRAAQTVMKTIEDKERLAATVLAFADELAATRAPVFENPA